MELLLQKKNIQLLTSCLSILTLFCARNPFFASFEGVSLAIVKRTLFNCYFQKIWNKKIPETDKGIEQWA